ncbi:hypothetical protein P0D69_44825 [Paraburkholderia sediminicola]|uniref:hypothetical protein n=1 Tax=Paraburkholderia sediminicola TaxID=458836 RepID=UPI0038BCBCC4
MASETTEVSQKLRKGHEEPRRINLIGWLAGWLRAALLGANNWIISTASLIVGIASAHAEISTKEAADAYASHFIADFNGRFGKVPRSTFGAHRPLCAEDDVDLILTCWVLRRVSKVLTVQYGRVIYLLEDAAANRGLIHSYLDVFEYPDRRIESRVNGVALCCVPYDRL